MNSEPHFPSSNRPIGFWIKAADKALDDAIDTIHAAEDIARRGWQVMNTVARMEPVAPEAIVETFAPMANRPQILGEIEKLENDGLIGLAECRYRLTGEGRELHARLEARQAAFRRRAMANIDEDDHAAAIRCLERIVANLSPDIGGE